MMELNEISKGLWELSQTGDMKVPARIYADKNIIETLKSEISKASPWSALKQLENVATLPGIQKAAIAMSDIHPGYGFPIGGVAAFDLEEGVISVAGVGFDCNCGVRTLRIPLPSREVEKKKKELADILFSKVPAGLGKKGKLSLDNREIDEMLITGARFAIEQGYGIESDIEFCEENGSISGADPEKVSKHAKDRQNKQVGTLGSGNHYLEIQKITSILNDKAAAAYGLTQDECLISIHCGSRALGHQIGTDYLKVLEAATKKYDIKIPEKELACAPINSDEGRDYLSAINCGINAAFANRQVISHLAREACAKVLDIAPEDMTLLYDVGHNTAKIEKHAGAELLVLRKGATRAFGPGRSEIPKAYRATGQPALIGGTMGTSSYILCGTKKGMKESFGSACHGAGRAMSRQEAKRRFKSEDILSLLEKKGIIIKGHSLDGIAEEAPGAYKDVDEVVSVMEEAGIAGKVAKLSPIVCVKG